jgi:prepilin peptidase CpaA
LVEGLGVLSLVSLAAAALFVIASYQDLRHRSIPDFIPVAVASAALVKWAILGEWAPALWAAAIAGIVFAVTAVMFARGWIGGGDVKLAAATLFLLGAPAAPSFLLGMAIVGGVIAAAMLVWRATRRDKAVPDAAPVTVPYGVAIGVAALVMLALEARDGWTA